MLMDIKLRKPQLSKMSQSGGFICNMLGNLAKTKIKNLLMLLARVNLPGLISHLA